MHAKLIACVLSASLVAAAPHQRRSPIPIAQSDIENVNNAAPAEVNGQPFSSEEFLFNFAQFFPQMVEFFSNPENLEIFNDPIFADARNADFGDPDVIGAGIAVENDGVPPPPTEDAPPAAAGAVIDQEIPPPPPEDEDSGDESEDDGPSDAAQIGNFIGDIAFEDDGAGDLIGAGIDLIGDIF